MALQGLTKYCGINRPGTHKVRYAPVAWVDAPAYERIISTLNNWQVAIPFVTPYNWLELPVFERGAGMNENSSRNDQGKVYEHELSGTLRHMKPSATGELEEMEEHRWLVLDTDGNGRVWLLGTLETPLDFQADAADGGDSGLNSYRFRFAGQVPQRMTGYVPI